MSPAICVDKPSVEVEQDLSAHGSKTPSLGLVHDLNRNAAGKMIVRQGNKRIRTGQPSYKDMPQRPIGLAPIAGPYLNQGDAPGHAVVGKVGQQSDGEPGSPVRLT